MPHPIYRAVSTVAILVAIAALGVAPAQADDDLFRATPVGVATSPLGLTRCQVRRADEGTFTVVNRTKHQLLTASIALRYFDIENTLMGQTTLRLSLDKPLTSGDTTALYSSIAVSLLEGPKAIARVECRPADATFTGNKRWTYGQRWTEKLLPVQTSSTQGEGLSAAGSRSSLGSTATPRFQVTVLNAWNDLVNGTLFVHDTIGIAGADIDGTLRPSDVILTMTLANGAKKTYSGLTQAAPTYQKMTSLGSQTITAYEVEPVNDFGRLGLIAVLAHAAVTTTVTFAVTDPVANPSDNRAVGLK